MESWGDCQVLGMEDTGEAFAVLAAPLRQSIPAMFAAAHTRRGDGLA